MLELVRFYTLYEMQQSRLSSLSPDQVKALLQQGQVALAQADQKEIKAITDAMSEVVKACPFKLAIKSGVWEVVNG